MAIVTGDRYLEKLVKFVEEQAGPLIEGALVLKLNPAGLHYVQSRLEALHELESLLTGAPVDYLRAYVSDLGDHRALEQLRRMLRLLTSLKVVSVLPPPLRDPTPLSLLPFGRLRILELRGCDLSTSAARGLLELRLTLEKIICHNSTDALRHVFASRIVEVKDSPQWNKLSFVSCACNALILMDESLQLLPAVETLDLSRNKFAKIDNLRKCVKLKHLDLGFNHLRAVASFTQVSHIIKLVLRNNALTSLRGVENLKSLEGLDVSYNIISNFSELEYLVGISSLQNLWLEGNPLCCARWYRAHVFSLFSHPDRLKLDDKGICNREFWKRKIIIASRQKRPASFGFYSPAEDGAQGEGSINRKKKMVPRIASIQSEEESTYFCSDQEYASCDNETQSRDEAALSDNEAEMVDLMNEIELVKKENSALWLREFENRMHYAPANTVNGNISRATLHPWKENYVKNRKTPQHLGECSRYISPDSIQASGDESSTNIVESENSFVDMSTGLSTSHYFGLDGSLGHDGEVPLAGKGKSILKESYGGTSSPSIHMKSLDHLSIRSLGGHANVEHVRKSPLNVNDDMSESYTSSIFPGSPPHYQEDILHRRHNLMEEILQLSAESYSVPSSDSNSTGSEDDIFPFGPLMPEVIEPMDDKALNGSAEGHLSLNHRKSDNFEQCCEFPLASKNGSCLFNSSADQTSSKQKPIYPGFSVQLPSNVVPADAHAYEIDHCVKYENSQRRKRENKKKLKKRVVSLLEYTSFRKTDTCESNQDVPGADMGSEQETKSFIENYFNLKIADSGVNETCRQYLKCICILDSELVYREREVVLLLSSKNKLYILIVGAAEDGSGTMLILLACHSVEDIREVFVGLGLQVVRVCMEKGINFLFVTKSIEKSRQLLSTLQVSDISTPSDKYFLRSLEQFQVELFEKQICGGVKVSIFQYSMVFFCCSEIHGEMWHPRSLFIIEGHLLVCIEDLMQFGSFSKEASLPPYFVLDSCCLIADIFEMVVEVRRAWCSTLSLKCAKSEFSLFPKYDEEFAAVKKENSASSSLKWEFKWVSEESLFNFIAVVKAIYLSSMGSPLLVRYLS